MGEWLFSLADAGSQVVVDFTHPDVVMEHIRFCIDQNIHAVVGTSGFDDGAAGHHSRNGWPIKPELGVIVVPNFAIGAVLTDPVRPGGGEVLRVGGDHRAAPRREGRRAVRHRSGSRHGRSRSPREAGPRVPSRTPPPTSADGARGADVDGIHVHSVRLPGLVAHQEIMLGSAGETADHPARLAGPLVVHAGCAGRGPRRPDRPGLTVGLDELLGLSD